MCVRAVPRARGVFNDVVWRDESSKIGTSTGNDALSQRHDHDESCC